MKKFITLLLALVMALSLTACGNQPAGDDADGNGNSVTATETDGRALYEAAIQLARDGDLPGGIEGLKKAVAAEETDTWTGLDIDLAYKRMAQLYRLLGDTEGQAQANADCLAARGWEPLGLDALYFEGNCDLDAYFDASPFGNWGNNILIYDLRGGDEFTLDETFPEKAEEMGFDAFFQWADECMRTNLYALVSAASFDSVTLDSYKQTHSKDIFFESPYVTFSACGVMTGMTREQVYAQLQMTPWCQVLVDHSFAKFTWELMPRYDGSEEYSLSVDTREYTDSDIVLCERLDNGAMCSLSLKFENDVLTWMQYRETKID